MILSLFISLAALSSCSTTDDVRGGLTVEDNAYTATPAEQEATQYDGYTLVWADEFNIDGKPSDAWSYEYGFVRNEELQWYQEDNATVADGCLVIEGRREKVENPDYVASSTDWRKNRVQANYTSSCLTTCNSYTFMYGRLEVRAKIPVAGGSWPAIWTLGNMWEWPLGGEIDVMEYYIRDGVRAILANACCGGAEEGMSVWNTGITPLTHFTDRAADWAEQFHVWRMDWDEEYIRIYLDDELLNAIDLSTMYNQGYNGNCENPFRNEVSGFGDFILLNLAIGSNGGTPDDAAFPLRYLVDYVRVYQKTDK